MPPTIHLRSTAPHDLETLFAFQCDAASCDMAGVKPRTRETFFGVWAQHFVNPKLNGQVIEIEAPNGREVVGSIACFQAPDDRGVEQDCVGYWLSRAHWGKGIAGAALKQFLALELRRPLHATTDAKNHASQRILLKCGFRLTGHRMGEETERYMSREIAEFVLE
jgi:RimJ/RimL family protein N-acetyltransferase